MAIRFHDRPAFDSDQGRMALPATTLDPCPRLNRYFEFLARRVRALLAQTTAR
jgi:hypothetical protein